MNGEANDKRRCVVKATLYQIKKKTISQNFKAYSSEMP